MRLLISEGDETLNQIHPQIDNYNKENLGIKMYILPVSFSLSAEKYIYIYVCVCFRLKVSCFSLSLLPK